MRRKLKKKWWDAFLFRPLLLLSLVILFCFWVYFFMREPAINFILNPLIELAEKIFPQLDFSGSNIKTFLGLVVSLLGLIFGAKFKIPELLWDRVELITIFWLNILLLLLICISNKLTFKKDG